MDNTTLGAVDPCDRGTALWVRCLQMLLEGAGAKVHCATSSAEGLRTMDRNTFSAAVLDYSSSAKGQRRIAQQLARIELPFVVCKDAGHDDFWPDTRVLIKPVMGTQLLEMLCCIIADQSIGTESSNATRLHPLVPPTSRPLTNVRSTQGDRTMANREQRGGREKRKPKAEKPKASAAQACLSVAYKTMPGPKDVLKRRADDLIGIRVVVARTNAAQVQSRSDGGLQS